MGYATKDGAAWSKEGWGEQQLGRRGAGLACKSQEMGIGGPVRNGLASSGDLKELGAIIWAGSRGWTLKERGVILETSDPGV